MHENQKYNELSFQKLKVRQNVPLKIDTKYPNIYTNKF